MGGYGYDLKGSLSLCPDVIQQLQPYRVGAGFFSVNLV